MHGGRASPQGMNTERLALETTEPRQEISFISLLMRLQK